MFKINNLVKYLELLKHYSNLLEAAPQDAAQPAAPAGGDVSPVPVAMPSTGASEQEQPVNVPPEGYVDIVRLLSKALVMNVPTEAVDSMWTTPVTKENAETMRAGIQNAIKENENYEDNPERLDNPHFKEFYNGINEKNFVQKYKQILGIMKRYSSDPKLG